jgi:hypothetical protein
MITESRDWLAIIGVVVIAVAIVFATMLAYTLLRAS